MQTQQTRNSFLGPKSYRDFRETLFFLQMDTGD